MAFSRSKSRQSDASYRSLPIYWPARWRLIWSARADRRAGLPLGLSPDTTPVLRALVTRHDEICERERARLLADLEPVEVRRAQLDAEIPALQRIVQESVTELSRVAGGPSREQWVDRRAGEHDLPEALIRQRRQVEHQRLVDAAEAARTEAERRLDAAKAEKASLEEQCQQRREIASSRALRYGDHTQRLAAVYRRALAKRHPQRDQLAERWQTDICPPPHWVVLDDAVPSSRATGVPA